MATTLSTGALVHDLDRLIPHLDSPRGEVRQWAVSLLDWCWPEAERAVAEALKRLSDSDASVVDTALESLCHLAPRLRQVPAEDEVECLIPNLVKCTEPGDERVLRCLRYLAPDRLSEVLRRQLSRVSRRQLQGLTTMRQALLFAANQRDTAVLLKVVEVAFEHRGARLATHTDEMLGLVNTVVGLDEPRVAAPILRAVATEMAGDDPSPVHALTLLLLAGMLGLGIRENVALPDYRELVSSRPTVAVEWLEMALERLRRVGVETSGLRKLAGSGRWSPVLRALLEELEDFTEDPGSGQRLAAGVLIELERAREAGDIPPRMLPWATIVAASARLRIASHATPGNADASESVAELNGWWHAPAAGSDDDLLLAEIGNGRLPVAERMGLVCQLLRQLGWRPEGGAGSTEPERRERARQVGERLWTSTEAKDARVGLSLLAGLDVEAAFQFIERTLTSEDASDAPLSRAIESAGLRLDRCAEWVDALLSGTEEWQISRGLACLAEAPARASWVAPIAGRWEELARADLARLGSVALRLPAPEIREHAMDETAPHATRMNLTALLQSLLQGRDAEGPREYLEETRRGASDSVQRQGQWLELRCTGCGRLVFADVASVAVDVVLVRDSAGREGVIVGGKHACARCGVEDEMELTSDSRLEAMAYASREELDIVSIQIPRVQPSIRTPRLYLDCGFDPEFAPARRARSNRLLSLGRSEEAEAALGDDPSPAAEGMRARVALWRLDIDEAEARFQRARARAELEPTLDETLLEEFEHLRQGIRRAREAQEETSKQRVVASEAEGGAEDRSGASPRTRRHDESTKVSRTRGIRVGRNDPCPCGSGRKYKACCIK